MHNAKRALTPMINIIGEMSTWHRPADALLAMDIERVAGAVSGLVKTCNRPDRVVQVRLLLQYFALNVAHSCVVDLMDGRTIYSHTHMRERYMVSA